MFEAKDGIVLENEVFWKEERDDAGNGRPIIGELLLHTVVDLLFLVEFTLPKIAQVAKSRVNYTIWYWWWP
ncbi:MAG TPA: hypothetical protein VHR86_00390 [Armatimonadota bacterium]|nr:hypothetical protein [Armatimonadota bacterium]